MRNALASYRYSFLAGTFAALGSFFGKLPTHIVRNVSSSTLLFDPILLGTSSLILMIICNVLNWRFFLKALNTAEQTLQVTVLSAASNYLISFTLGTIIYNEPASHLTLIGFVLILSGLPILCTTSGDTVAGNKT